MVKKGKMVAMMRLLSLWASWVVWRGATGRIGRDSCEDQCLGANWLHTYKCLLWVLNKSISIEDRTRKVTKVAEFAQQTKQPRKKKK